MVDDCSCSLDLERILCRKYTKIRSRIAKINVIALLDQSLCMLASLWVNYCVKIIPLCGAFDQI